MPPVDFQRDLLLGHHRPGWRKVVPLGGGPVILPRMGCMAAVQSAVLHERYHQPEAGAKVVPRAWIEPLSYRSYAPRGGSSSWEAFS
jgi:hypothetical protein